MKTALRVADVNGFPYQLSPLKTKKPLPIPAVDFTEPAPSIKKISGRSSSTSRFFARHKAVEYREKFSK